LAGVPAAGATLAPGLKLGVMDGVLGLSTKPEAVASARGFGLAALQVTLGRTPEGDGLLLDDPALQSALRAEAKKHGLPLDATYIDILHTHCLKNDPKARDLVVRGIDVTRKLGAPILMTVFFGQCSLTSPAEIDTVADIFKELAPEAKRAGVILGFENLLKAEDNARALDRVASDAFKIYYDVGNSTNTVGVDAAREIRWLGRDRICQFHFKDKGYLGQGKVDFPAVLAAVDAIGFRGYANLETNAPSGNTADDLKRNIAYLRGLQKP
ncbi:MAG TPA: sugar phosphate isomerase/epimerase family protein, partial [Bryobacteraceae bacterium]|nr:sugar phosphate isomerase/epimerase family protein [Bryobacteraceae bacterium]